MQCRHGWWFHERHLLWGSGSTIKMQFHAKADCSDDTSAKCVIDILDPTNAVTTHGLPYDVYN